MLFLNRQIQENIILVHELMYTLRRKQRQGGLLAAKINMEKAYDKVDWGVFTRSSQVFWFFSKVKTLDFPMHIHHLLLHSLEWLTLWDVFAGAGVTVRRPSVALPLHYFHTGVI